MILEKAKIYAQLITTLHLLSQEYIFSLIIIFYQKVLIILLHSIKQLETRINII